MLNTKTATDKKNQTSEGLDLIFNEMQLGWLEKARKFADSISHEETLRSDSKNEFRRDLFEKACQEGFGALPFPAEYKESGSSASGDYLSFCLVNEEFARRCVPIMSSLGVHVLCQEPVYRFGTEEQKRHYLTASSSGKYLAAFGLTEPNAGSDTAALETTARLEGDSYILNGTKTFITSGASADYYIVMARISGDAHIDFPDGHDRARRDAGITAFIVDRDAPGFEIGQKFDMLGMRGYSTCELVFNDCRVSVDKMLGAPGQGRKVALSSLAKGRVTIAAQATGWAQGALEGLLEALRIGTGEEFSSEFASGTPAETAKCTALEKQRERIADTLGDLYTTVETARLLTYQAAATIDEGKSDVTLAAMAKISATDAAMKVSTEALSIVGEAGLLSDSPKIALIERIFRDAKAGQIYEGTNQIQRMLIARDLLK